MARKSVLILGAGAVGSMVGNKLAREFRREIAKGEIEITVLDRSEVAVNQAGFTFVPFGYFTDDDLVRPRRSYLSPRLRTFLGREFEIKDIDLGNRVVKVSGGRSFSYDYLVIATGASFDLKQVPGLERDFNSFYTSLEDAKALGRKIRSMEGGRIVVFVPKMPIACPGAPSKFTVMLDNFLRAFKDRDRFEITFLWPSPNIGPPAYNENITRNLKERGIDDVRGFKYREVDPERKVVVGEDGEYPYDLLITVPPHVGALRGLSVADEDGWVPNDKFTLQYRGPAGSYDEVYVAGDAGSKEILKMGVTAHFQAFVVGENLARDLMGIEERVYYRGHMGCPYVEESPTPASHGRATLAVWKYGVPLSPFKAARLGWKLYRMYYLVYWDTTMRGLM